MTVHEPIAGNSRHIITASSGEHRDQLVTDFFNHFETLEKSKDVVVLKRREITFNEQKYQERRAFDRSWKGWLLFFLFMGNPTETAIATSAREEAAVTALPLGTDMIEIHLPHRQD